MPFAVLAATLVLAPERPERTYDLRDVDYRVELTGVDGVLKGDVTHTLVMLPGKTQARFDVKRLAIGGVTLDDKACSFSQDENHLTVDVPEGEHRVRIRYEGRPQAGLVGTVTGTLGGAESPLVVTQNAPDLTRYWLPGYDALDDKATVTSRVLAPRGWRVTANGKLAGQPQPQGDARVLWTWRQDTPQTVPDIAFAAGPMVETLTGTVPRVSYLTPAGLESWGDAAFGRAQRASQTYERLLGVPFPFVGVAHVPVADAPSAGVGAPGVIQAPSSALFPPGLADVRTSDLIVGRGIARQWFGGVLTPATWSHAWVREGFARLAPLYWVRETRGFERFDLERLALIRAALAAAQADPRPLVRTDWTEGDEMINPLTAEGAAARLLYLLRLVGEEPFWGATGDVIRKHGAGNATTEEAFSTLSASLKRDLAWFESQWFRGGGAPRVTVVKTKEGWVARQASPAFRLPTDLLIDGVRVPVTLDGPETPLPVPPKAKLVLLDSEVWLPAEIGYDAGYTAADWTRLFYTAPNNASRARLIPQLKATLPPAEFVKLVTTVRSAALLAEIMPSVEDVPTLTRWTFRGEASVRYHAAKRLRELAQNGVALDEAARKRLADLDGLDKSEMVRREAIGALGEATGDPSYAEKAWLRDGYEDAYRTWALDWWSRKEPARARQLALSAINGPASEALVRASLRTLGVVKDDGAERLAFDALAKSLRQPSMGRRVLALEALGRYGDVAARPLIEPLRENAQPAIRRAANAALEALPKPNG